MQRKPLLITCSLKSSRLPWSIKCHIAPYTLYTCKNPHGSWGLTTFSRQTLSNDIFIDYYPKGRFSLTTGELGMNLLDLKPNDAVILKGEYSKCHALLCDWKRTGRKINFLLASQVGKQTFCFLRAYFFPFNSYTSNKYIIQFPWQNVLNTWFHFTLRNVRPFTFCLVDFISHFGW